MDSEAWHAAVPGITVRHNGVTELNMLKYANTVLGYLLLLGLIFNFFVCAFVKFGESKSYKTKCATLKIFFLIIYFWLSWILVAAQAFLLLQ